jgi:hypothetical protein
MESWRRRGSSWGVLLLVGRVNGDGMVIGRDRGCG